ncbi:MAG TPA: serine/threonine-protein kinase [Polyangiaceae bacterium]|nr:serine/threonine-protein kinase [Polyangiaceae bacterium]
MKHAEHHGYEVVVGQLSPGAALDQYVVKGCLGNGGMALVYEAEDTVLCRPVAIKMLSVLWSADSSVRSRFMREARAAATLRHPNVVAVFEVGRYRETPYLVMECLQGESLSQLLLREGPRSVQQTADLLLPVLSAMAAAHALGIVHRDLKPENIFLSRSESGVITPKVLDFGISKMLLPSHDSDITRSDVLLGTPNYMAPEHVEGKEQIDARSDIFSLGVVMYECVTGERPFAASSLHAILEAIVSHHPPPPSELSAKVSREFSDIVMRALSKKADRRYPDVRELGAALLPFASARTKLMFEQDFVPSAAPQRAGRRLARSLRRASYLGLGLALLGGAAWVSYHFGKGRVEPTGRAEVERDRTAVPTTHESVEQR